MVTIDTCGFEVTEEESFRCWCWVRISGWSGAKIDRLANLQPGLPR
jgi:hypothetical protein